MTMPELSGPDVFARLREIRPDLPVVLMSGYHEDELAPDIGAGISGFIQKPFTPTDLAVRMRAALEPESVTPGPPAVAAAPAAPAAPAEAAGSEGQASTETTTSDPEVGIGRDGI
jgi:CheY-like chemotaxis protein